MAVGTLKHVHVGPEWNNLAYPNSTHQTTYMVISMSLASTSSLCSMISIYTLMKFWSIANLTMLKCHCSNGWSPFAPEDELNTVSKHIGVICTVSLWDGKEPQREARWQAIKPKSDEKTPWRHTFKPFCVFNTIAIIVSLNNSVLVRHRYKGSRFFFGGHNPRPVAGNMIKHCIPYTKWRVWRRPSKNTPSRSLFEFICQHMQMFIPLLAPEHLQTMHVKVNSQSAACSQLLAAGSVLPWLSGEWLRWPPQLPWKLKFGSGESKLKKLAIASNHYRQGKKQGDSVMKWRIFVNARGTKMEDPCGFIHTKDTW